VDQVGFDLVQLSGHEDRQTVQQMPRDVVKAIHVQPGQEEQAAALVERDALGAAYYLLDGYKEGWYGGIGEAWNWLALRAVGPRCLAAGGLRPDNVQVALDALAPMGVDVSGGVEYAEGGKDPARVRAFLEAVRRYDDAHAA
jgi:phosphoribosylanthranilate isomerase